ncbi:hypothetical protein F2Q69_00007745 [Brassica cretica]|uniref:Uncharacterized protein n=1 Tax=Brassica cretica TaxID=69181 RepID=A0A8S9P5F8_BRACR|nr:hypothetical protein F2Q69_00007745 [Brassica cretica]
MTHEEFAAKHPHPPSPVHVKIDRQSDRHQEPVIDRHQEPVIDQHQETIIDQQPRAPIDRRAPITYRVPMPEINVARLNALRPKPKPSENPPKAVRTPSDDGIDSVRLINLEILLLGYCHKGGTWPEQVVDLSICCSEHDVLRETPSCPSWYLIKGRFPFILRQDKSFALEAGGQTLTRRQGPRPGGRNPKPRGRNLEAGTRRRELGSWRNNMIFFIGLRESHHGIKFLVEFGDKMLPPCWGLVGVGRRFDGEAGIVCIKGDASAHTPYAYAALVAILGLSSGRTSVCIP